MRRVAYETPERYIAWAADKMQMQFRQDAKAIASVDGSEIRAVVVFDTFCASDCLLHVVSDGSRRWMTREFVVRCFAFPFIQCGFSRVSALVSVDNTDSLRFSRHLGWVEEGRRRGGGPRGEDEIIFGMLRRECRFLPPAR